MAQGRSTKTISTIKWIRTSRLSIKNSLFLCRSGTDHNEERSAEVVRRADPDNGFAEKSKEFVRMLLLVACAVAAAVTDCMQCGFSSKCGLLVGVQTKR